MNACERARELLGGYVLRALEPDEAEEVRGHLTACPACARELEQLEGLPRLLDLAGSAHAIEARPPAALEAAVLRGYVREHEDAVEPGSWAAGRDASPPPRSHPARGRRRPWRSPLLAPALLGGLTGGAATLAVLAAIGSFSGGETYDVAMQGSPAAPGASAAAVLEPVREGTRVRLRTRGLPAGELGEVYEVWLVRDGVRTSAGTFRPFGDGRADLVMSCAKDPDEYDRIGVTREPNASDPAANGPNVLAGRIEH